jgi:malonate transporter MadL subunit
MRPFLRALNWGTLPLLAYFALRRYLQAMNVVLPIMFALISANLVNLVGDWALIYGHLGLPAMGIPGSGWATCFARIYMAKKDILPKLTELGVEYWGAMYIPVVVAMAAQQDVVAALRGGPVALLSAVGAAALCACVIAFINRTERPVVAAEPAPVLHNELLTEVE